jgi:Uma2 family endonuclease
MTEPAYKLPRETDGQSWPAQGEWTYEDYLRLPEDGNRYEVIRGVLYVTPAPTYKHQIVAGNLQFRFRSFVEERDLGVVLYAPFDVKLPFRIGTPVQPDILFFRKGNTPDWEDKSFEGVPDLVAEVISPRTRSHDRTTKLKAYQDASVPEYWLVDPDVRTVVVYGLENGKYVELVSGGTGDTVWSSILLGFRVNVTDLFMP